MLHTLNVCSAVCQAQLNETEKQCYTEREEEIVREVYIANVQIYSVSPNRDHKKNF